MNLSPDIVSISEKKLVGKSMTMSFAAYRVADLWRSFGPLKSKIPNRMNEEMISMVQYQPDHFSAFDATRTFEKWAAVEVSQVKSLAESLETTTIPVGLYAVFHYKGLNTDNSIYRYIFGTWFPQSEYEIDERPHFEVLGNRYKNNDPDSEEDIYIPIKPKA